MNTKEELELFRTYCGSKSVVTSTHINQTLGNSFATVNKNVQINIAKLRDFVERTRESDNVE